MSADKNKVTRLWVLLVVLVVGFSSIWLLPTQQEMRPSQLSQQLPGLVGKWTGVNQKVSPVELKVLADDTNFSRKEYTISAEPNFPGVVLSVVFSGKDINNSLHRPEVCLRAQGWNFVRERSLIVENALPDGRGLPVREIVCVRPRVKNAMGDPPINKFGEPVYDKLVQYYTFFGAEKIVSGHYERTFADIEARLLGGYDQQWAYATFGATVTGAWQEQGFDIAAEAAYSEEQTIELLEEFVRTVMPEVLKSEE